MEGGIRDRGTSPQVGRILIKDETERIDFASAMRETLSGRI